MHRRKSAGLREELRVLKCRYRHAYGWHLWFGLYDLESFDGGKMWYALRTGPCGRRLIQGEAEQVYPGLLAEQGILECVQDAKPLLRNVRAKPSNKELSGLVPNRQQQSQATNDQACSEYFQLSLGSRVHKQSICMRLPAIVSP
jgi:hypothetical protein